MCVEFPPEDLNPDPYAPYPTNTYTCRVITAVKILLLRGTLICLSCLLGFYALKRLFYFWKRTTIWHLGIGTLDLCGFVSLESNSPIGHFQDQDHICLIKRLYVYVFFFFFWFIYLLLFCYSTKISEVKFFFFFSLFLFLFFLFFFWVSYIKAKSASSQLIDAT